MRKTGLPIFMIVYMRKTGLPVFMIYLEEISENEIGTNK